MWHWVIILFLLVSPSSQAGSREEMPPMHHLVDIAPPARFHIPDDFPLNDEGRLDCDTCHGIEDIEDIPLDKVNRDDDDFFRGGPYEKPSDFCFRCHRKDDLKRPNIHILRDERGALKKARCLLCHDKTPDPEDDRLKDVEFRIPPEDLCYGCHLDAPHINARNHLRKPDDEMRRRMQEAEREHGIILPLDSRERIMCATCHSPHQAGVIDRDSPAGRQVEGASLEDGITYQAHPWNAVYQADKRDRLAELRARGTHAPLPDYRRIKTEVLLRLPARDGTLCLSCHVFEK